MNKTTEAIIEAVSAIGGYIGLLLAVAYILSFIFHLNYLLALSLVFIVFTLFGVRVKASAKHED